jgi:hypothetical protein
VLRLALPPSLMNVQAGSVIKLKTGPSDTQFRVDRVDQGTSQLIEAVRIEPNLYRSAPFGDEPTSMRPFLAATPVYPLFMDLPLITGNESPHAPHIAVTSDPWPGVVAVYDAPLDADYGLNTYVPGRSIIGETLTPLSSANSGVIDRGPALRVKLVSGQLSSISRQALLAGGNLAAIGDGSPENWEVFQFQTAELADVDTYDLTLRLRGQAGTDGLMPSAWPAGSKFVLLDGVPSQINLRSADRGVERFFRVGPASRAYDDLSYEARSLTFDGAGLRPYTPAHLKADYVQGGTLTASWIRRTRIDGDEWSWGEVPLNETSEQYLAQIWQGNTMLREVIQTQADLTYSAAEIAEDGATGQIELRVAQISDRFGPGPFAKTQVVL